VLRAGGEARLTHLDGDLHLNGIALPAQARTARIAEQLANELDLRAIAGVRFAHGLTVPELELFMRYFLPSEVYRGPDLERACATQGIRHAVPMPWAPADAPVACATPDVPAAYQAALDACARAQLDAQWLIGAGLPRGVATHRYQRIVQPLVDAALAGDPLSAGLADLDHDDPELWSHGLHLCLLAVLVGRALGLDRAALAELGVAALLHGADEADVPEGVEPGSLALLRRSRLAPLDPTMLVTLRAALPSTAAEGGIDPALPGADVLRIADAYLTLATRRVGGMPQRTPHDALGMVLGPLAGHFHPALRAALVRAIGVHPPGQIVELDDGTVARVCAADPRDPRRSLLERMTGPGAERLESTARGQVAPLAEGRRVARAVPFTRPDHLRSVRLA
jgi:HD-GYP domain-containing protein (c-di-GMP phosphodiesterase class II)